MAFCKALIGRAGAGVYKHLILFKMTASIQDMLQLCIIQAGDRIEFSFKGNTFYAKILRGGIIGECSMKKPYENTETPITKFASAFSSLTAWTEACLQDLLEEYYTRYSSWKRVTHCETKRSMSDLRDQCKIYLRQYNQEENIELFKEIHRLQELVTKLKTYINKCDSTLKKDWCESELVFPALKIQAPVPRKRAKIEIDVSTLKSAQELLLNNSKQTIAT